MVRPLQEPATLYPSWRHIPRLAWVTARAFLGSTWPHRLGDAWALASGALVYLPILLSAALRQHLAASTDNHALVVISTSRRDRLVLIGVELVHFTVVVVVFHAATSLVLGSVTTWTGVIVSIVVLFTLALLILLLTLREVVVAAVQLWKVKTDRAERYTAQLRRRGHTVWAIGPWAAWPPSRRSGTDLVDELLPQVPHGVWLVAVARNSHIARTFDTRGFLNPADDGLLRVRPPAGQTPPPFNPKRWPLTPRPGEI
jgi:hypothetical protein